MDARVRIRPEERSRFVHSTRLLSRMTRKGEPKPEQYKNHRRRISKLGLLRVCWVCGQRYTGVWYSAADPSDLLEEAVVLPEGESVQRDHICEYYDGGAEPIPDADLEPALRVPTVDVDRLSRFILAEPKAK